jgi:two-component system sensor histidine kinase MprB
VALASLAAYFTVRHQLYSEVDNSLVGEMSAVTDVNAPGAAGQFNPSMVGNFLHRYANSVLQVIDGQGTVRFNGPNGLGLPVTDSQAGIAGTRNTYSIQSVKTAAGPYRVITQGGFVDAQTGVPLAIQIARPLSDINHTLSDLRLILWLVTLIGIGVSIAMGYLLGRATMRPVKRLTAAAEHVAATQDLESKISEEGDDELARLAHSFNSMLAALAASRQQQAQLISDAGHELRTPLTSLRTNIEVLMRQPNLPDGDRDELITDVQAQLEELTTLIGDVVELAREDERRIEPIEVRFDAIVEHAIERARRRAPAIRFESQITAGSVRAQPALLERAVLNVLDNAVKWSPPEGPVHVSLVRADRWVLEVRDHGPGIADHDLPRVFDRFYRAPAARALPGSGLGLAIVRQVIMEHGGWVSASSPEGGGTLIHIELPIVAETEPDAPVANGSLADHPEAPQAVPAVPNAIIHE